MFPMVMGNITQRIMTNCKQIHKYDVAISPWVLSSNLLMHVLVLIFHYFDKISEPVNLKNINIYWDSL